MEYLFDLLIDPIEITKFEPNEEKLDKLPDSFRQYPFNIPNFTKGVKCDKDCAQETNTDINHWEMSKEKRNKYFFELVEKYSNFYEYPDFDEYHLSKNQIWKNIPSEILNYYQHVYDIADIIIHQQDDLVDILGYFLPNFNKYKTNTVMFRMIFYLSYHYVEKNLNRTLIARYIITIKKKLKELQNENIQIMNYMTEQEISDYLCKFDNLWKKHCELITVSDNDMQLYQEN